MTPEIVLLPSPLLGPAVWEPVAERLRERGQTVSVARLPSTVSSPAEVLAGFVAAVPDRRPVTLVPHSNAGLYVAELARQRRVTGIVFVDAAFPSRSAMTPVAPGYLVEHLLDLADERGVVPEWSRWWDEADVAALFPDPETRRRVEAEQRRLPIGYFTGWVPTPAGWDATHPAYLAFGETYRDEVEAARERGWPTLVTTGGHLQMLTDPDGVAALLTELLRER